MSDGRCTLQSGFWPKWDGEGEPTGPVFWEIEGHFATEAEARADLADQVKTCGVNPALFRVVPGRGGV